jgi:hypothetical protein
MKETSTFYDIFEELPTDADKKNIKGNEKKQKTQNNLREAHHRQSPWKNLIFHNN